MKQRLLLAGYFGCGNYGDDAILLGFLNGIHDDGFQYSILASQPERMVRTYGLTAVARFDGSQVKQAIAESDALVFPGGSIFQDSTSVRSVFYYWGLVRQAARLKKKVFLLGQGVGPVRTFFGKRLTAASFNRASAVVVRDPQSAQTLKSLGVKHTPRVAADMAFLLPEPDMTNAPSFGAGGMKAVGLSIRPFGKDRSKGVVSLYSELAKMLFQNGYMPVMVGLDENEDIPLIEQVSKLNGGKVPDLKGVSGPGPLQQRIGRMDGVISMRLHGAILATTVGVPSIMLSYDPKVAAFANALGISSPLTMDGLTPARVMDAFLSMLKDREKKVETVRRRRDDFAKQAQLNLQALREGLA